jgi:hypothetical protein
MTSPYLQKVFQNPTKKDAGVLETLFVNRFIWDCYRLLSLVVQSMRKCTPPMILATGFTCSRILCSDLNTDRWVFTVLRSGTDCLGGGGGGGDCN